MSLAPLRGILAIELAGLAPGPLCGQMLADYGAEVIRIDRCTTGPQIGTGTDRLTRGKKSIALNLRDKKGVDILKTILSKADVLLDPYRPGVLERLGLGPEVFLHPETGINKRLVIARLTGYGQTSELKGYAGHDVNYMGVSGVLDLIGPADRPPAFPATVLGDFAGLSGPGFTAIVLGLFQRVSTGIGLVLDVNIVQSLQYFSQFASLSTYDPKGDSAWGRPRGENLLEGGAPFYGVYETKDPGEYVSLGALEPQFYDALIKCLGLIAVDNDDERLSDLRYIPNNRYDLDDWPRLRKSIEHVIRSHGVQYWHEKAAEYPDSCLVPLRRLVHPSKIPPALVTFPEANTKPFGAFLQPGLHTGKIISRFLGEKAWSKIKGDDYVQQATAEKL